MKRYPVNKRKAARKFSRQVLRTKAPNVLLPAQRGGFRL